MRYIAYLHKDGKSDFGVSFPDFPGCITAGKTLDEARRLAPEVLKLHITGMLEDGDAIPEPTPLDDLTKDPAMKNATAFIVDIDVPERVERFNITARRSQIQEIDRLARKRGMTRSAFMVSASLERGSRPSR